MIDACSPFGQRAQCRQLVRQFVQLAATPADRLRGYLAGEAKHRRVAGISRAQGRRGIQHAGSRDHAIGAHSARGARVAKRHICGTLLVAGADQANPGAGAVDRIEEVIQLPAGQTEDGIHAVGRHGFQQSDRTGYPRHLPTLLLSLITNASRVRNSQGCVIPNTERFQQLILFNLAHESS